MSAELLVLFMASVGPYKVAAYHPSLVVNPHAPVHLRTDGTVCTSIDLPIAQAVELADALRLASQGPFSGCKFADTAQSGITIFSFSATPTTKYGIKPPRVQISIDDRTEICGVHGMQINYCLEPTQAASLAAALQAAVDAVTTATARAAAHQPPAVAELDYTPHGYAEMEGA